MLKSHLSKKFPITFMVIWILCFSSIGFASPAELTADNSGPNSSPIRHKRLHIRYNNYITTWYGAYRVSRRDWGMNGPKYIGEPVKILYPPLHSTNRPDFDQIDNY